jgi:hypothetical protein
MGAPRNLFAICKEGSFASATQLPLLTVRVLLSEAGAQTNAMHLEARCTQGAPRSPLGLGIVDLVARLELVRAGVAALGVADMIRVAHARLPMRKPLRSARMMVRAMSRLMGASRTSQRDS